MGGRKNIKTEEEEDQVEYGGREAENNIETEEEEDHVLDPRMKGRQQREWCAALSYVWLGCRKHKIA